MHLVPTADRAEPGPPNSAFVIVLILNWDTLADTLQCVESVRKSDYPRLAVWVVDNGSDEDPSDRLDEQFPSERYFLYYQDRMPRGPSGPRDVAG